VTEPRPVYYLYTQLAGLWHVHVVTVRRWVSQDQRRLGVKIVWGYTRNRHGGRGAALIREDVAIDLFVRHRGRI
jgi:hypothetical protein